MLESLENRSMLAADLGVSFDSGGLNLPTIAVPGDFVSPDTDFDLPIRIINNGPQAANGLINIAFYLSTDTTLNTSSDVLMREYRNEAVFLPVYNNNPDNIGTFAPDTRVPPEVAPGSYYIIVRITYPNTQIDDFNASNNIAVSDNPVTVERKFGSVGGRNNVTMVLEDAEGTLVAFSMTGAGTGSVSVDSQGRYAVTTNSTGNVSDVNITTSGGDGTVDLSAVTINGSLRAFSAASARLVGTFNPGTSISTVTLGNVIDAGTLTIPGTSVTPTLVLGDVRNFSISSAVGITSITAKSWVNTDSTADTISAPYLDVLTVRGATTGTGNFNANLRLSGGAATGQTQTLRTATVGGKINGGSWVINGPGGTITANATTAAWSATFLNRLVSVTTTLTLRGTITAGRIGTITSGWDVLGAKVLAGTFLGQDGVLGGVGADADSFGVGRIDRFLVTRNVANTIVGAGLASISGTGLGEPRMLIGGVNSKLGEVRVGNVAAPTARFLANTYLGPTTIGGVSVNAATDARFQIVTLPPTATVASSVVGTSNVTMTINFSSYGLMNRATILSGVVRITGPNGFDQLATLVSKRNLPGSLQAGAESVFSLASPGASWTSGDNGTYTIAIVAGTVADARGNAMTGGQIGQFTIAV